MSGRSGCAGHRRRGNMPTTQALIFAVIQGITEFFPISSVAHGVLTPFLFGWHLDPTFLKEHFLPFVVMLHLGTAMALLVYFRRDWLAPADRRPDRPGGRGAPHPG